MSNVAVARMTNTDKVGEALRRSLPYLPEDAKRIVESMLTPASLAIIVGTLVVWAGAHFFGVGEIVDAILLAVGVVTLGFSVFEGASELYSFAKGALNAKSEKDLDEAGRHFARAVTILGISTKYTEEVLAEGYAQLRVNGLAQALGAIKFPIKNGYVIVTRRGNIRINTPIATQMKMEGVAIGSIFLGGELFQLSISFGSN